MLQDICDWFLIKQPPGVSAQCRWHNIIFVNYVFDDTVNLFFLYLINIAPFAVCCSSTSGLFCSVCQLCPLHSMVCAPKRACANSTCWDNIFPNLNVEAALFHGSRGLRKIGFVCLRPKALRLAIEMSMLTSPTEQVHSVIR